jgi:methylenetetrahydrofolate reductase (NADPH)
MKINEKIAKAFQEDTTGKKTFYSFEYFPARTEAGIENLLDRIERMGQQNPLWIDVTWSAGGRSSEITLDICNHLQNYSGLDVLMHLTCTFMTREKVVEALDSAKKCGIRNILALRGDPPIGSTGWVHQDNGFNHAIDLVRFIKENYGDHFCIVVAGYPETHPDAPSPEADIQYLKDKCEAGADIVIT